MLAARLPGLLPPLDSSAALESAAVLSLAGQFRPERFAERVYRSPHHTASAVALVGGGSTRAPAKSPSRTTASSSSTSCPEFDRRVLESLREPLESGHIHISRAARQAEFPARFQLIAAMNPCPCGWHGDRSGRCRCTPDQVSRYRGSSRGRCSIASTSTSTCRPFPPKRCSNRPTANARKTYAGVSPQHSPASRPGRASRTPG